MNEKRCPSEAELVSFVDVDLSPEKLERLELHLGHCPACAQKVAELRELVACVAAPLPQEEFDVTSHVEGVMQRLDAPVAEKDPAHRGRWVVWSGVAAVAAAASFALFTHHRETLVENEFAARGGEGESSLSRDVGVQLYTQSTAVQALSSGSRIRASAPLTAGLRNLGKEPAYLLLFAVDANQAVHWIAPAYTVVGSDPEAVKLTPAAAERLLPSAAVFDDLVPGSLRVYAVITREPSRVSSVEQLPPSGLSAERLLARFPNAEIRQFSLEVTQ